MKNDKYIFLIVKLLIFYKFIYKQKLLFFNQKIILKYW